MCIFTKIWPERNTRRNYKRIRRAQILMKLFWEILSPLKEQREIGVGHQNNFFMFNVQKE
jgi:hypothetical protein